MMMIASPPSVNARAAGACVRGELADAREHPLAPSHAVALAPARLLVVAALKPCSDAVRELAVELEVVR
jgi:hypothetical protein